MSALQRKARIPIVLKDERFPAYRRMATGALRLRLAEFATRELTVMNVRMAAGAVHRKGLHPNCFLTRIALFHRMTFQTYNLPVFALQRKARQFMVKRCAMPGLR